jgi:hypothetical protein
MVKINYNVPVKQGSGLATGCGNICEVSTAPICNITIGGNYENFENCEGKTVFTLDDFICGICEERQTLPLWSRVSEFQEIQGITQGMTYKELSMIDSNGSTLNKGVFVPKMGESVQVFPNEENAIFYEEFTEVFANQRVITDIVNSTVIPVQDASKYFVNNKVLVEVIDPDQICSPLESGESGESGECEDCPECSIRERRTIVDVDYELNTITLDSPVDMFAGFRIIQLWEWLKRCDLPSINRTQLTKKFVKVYLQYFGGGFEIKQSELKKCYRSGVDAQRKVKEILTETFKKTALDVMAAEWLGLNIPETSSQEAETQGILPLIQYYNNQGVDNHYDLTGIKTAYGKASALVDIFDEIQRGMQEDMMVVTTFKGFKKFQKISEQFHKLTGHQVMISAEESVRHRFRVHTWEGVYGGRMMIYVNTYLNYLYEDHELLVFFPNNRHFVLDPQMSTVTDSMQVSHQVLSGVPIVERKFDNEGKIDCDRRWYYNMKLGFATQGAAEGKVGIIQL